MYRIILSFLSFFGGKSSPVRLYPKQSFREKYEAELILGELQDDEYYSVDDEYHDLEGGII